MTRSNKAKWIGGAASAVVVAAMIGPVVASASASTVSAGAVTTHSAAVNHNTVRLTADQARAAVLTKVPTAQVISIRTSQHRGYQAFAVKIARTDGSTVTGYVDSASGVVFDWSHPTAPAVHTSGSQSSPTGGQDSEDSQDTVDMNDSQDETNDSEEGQSGDQTDSSGGQHGDNQDSANDDGGSGQNDE